MGRQNFRKRPEFSRLRTAEAFLTPPSGPIATPDGGECSTNFSNYGMTHRYMKSPNILSRFGLLTAALLTCSTLSRAAEQWVYFGTYTRGSNGSKGIYLSRFDSETGKLSAPELAGEVDNPSFLAIHQDGRHLYAVSEISDANGKRSGAISALAIDPKTGHLTFLNAESSEGTGPCHVSVDPSGRCVLTANYGSGSCASLPLAADGSIKPAATKIQHEGSGADPKRQAGPHAHSANPSPDGKYAVVADLGLDKVFLYALDAESGTMKPHGATVLKPASGPRHFAFHPGGKWGYAITEMALTVVGFDYDAARGTLTEFQSIATVPDDVDRKGLSTAEVQVHKSGKFLYGSNRGHDTIAVYAIDQSNGHLTFVEREPIQGKTPRAFGIDLTGHYLFTAGQASNTISVFKINQDTGALDYTGTTIEVPSPVCVKFLAKP